MCWPHRCVKRFSNLENHSTFSHKILQWDHHHKAQHHPNRRKVIQSDRNASLGYTPKWAVVKRFANINPIFYLFIKAVPSQQGHMMQQMPMNAPPHHLQQNGPSHLSSAPNHLQHHPPMAPHGTIFFLLSLMAFQMNCLQIVLVSFMKNIFHFYFSSITSKHANAADASNELPRTPNAAKCKLCTKCCKFNKQNRKDWFTIMFIYDWVLENNENKLYYVCCYGYYYKCANENVPMSVSNWVQ